MKSIWNPGTRGIPFPRSKIYPCGISRNDGNIGLARHTALCITVDLNNSSFDIEFENDDDDDDDDDDDYDDEDDDVDVDVDVDVDDNGEPITLLCREQREVER
ncbi:hypothetical protein HZH68_004367 [Vespula germanica]|uniref:Uncharacterized protein n=1 Tax=Vespula germanica TaxID=30212 RepID=A0A834KNE2_VESGE|nr:hypothetical protein HZH68_004367 [Vespula germanica]